MFVHVILDLLLLWYDSSQEPTLSLINLLVKNVRLEGYLCIPQTFVLFRNRAFFRFKDGEQLHYSLDNSEL